MEWGVGIVECKVQRVWSVKCGMWSVKCGVGSGKWGLLSVKCGVCGV